MIKDLSILYVEDDLDIAEEIGFFLKKRVKNLYLAQDGEEGLQLYKKYNPDVVITDVQMPRMNGLEMSAKIRELDALIPIIITSAYNDNEFLSTSINLNINGYIVKPINLKRMVNAVEKAFEPQYLKQELDEKNRLLIEINKNLDKKVKEKTKQLEDFYYHDLLTGLHNIVKLNADLTKYTHNYLLILDISNFSVVNKQYGKPFADEVLKETAHNLQQHAKSTIHLYKIESDRFVFIVKNKEEALEFCQQIIGYFDNNILLVQDHPISISFNIGIAEIQSNNMSIINAEYALDIGKKLGSRYYTYYNQDESRYKEEKMMIEWLNITQEMIISNNIEPYFQPIYNIEKNVIDKFEVLARGFYNGNVIAPINFLESAKRLGLITTITKMMINKSFAFFQQNDYQFSINITDRDLVEDYLQDFLEKKLKKYSIDPQRLTLEILENVTISLDHEEITERLARIKDLGIKIAVDDFGVENSNFSRLVELDFDYIKLDGLFIKNLDVNSKDIIVVKAIVQLAKALNIQTVAEFVENETIYKIVKECGVDYAQGYHIGKPSSSLEKKL
ncbi:EAL domain-containing protein [Sulfurimonas sp.]